MKTFFLILLFIPFFSFAQDHGFLGVDQAKRKLKYALNNRAVCKKILKDVIRDRQTAVTIAESILFKIYGKERIIKERPYEIYLINHYWVISGTLEKGAVGGCFLIIFSANDGQILRIAHYK